MRFSIIYDRPSPNYWPRCFPHRIWRSLYSASRSYGAGDRQVLDMVARLVGVFGRALTQENGPRRRRGNKPRAVPSLYRAFAPLCMGVRGLLRHGVLSWTLAIRLRSKPHRSAVP